MVGTCRFWRYKQENQIDREPVQSLEVDRPLKSRENAKNPLTFGELAVRDGDAVADAGRA